MVEFRDWSPYKDNYRYGYKIGLVPHRIGDLFIKTNDLRLEEFYKKVRQKLAKTN